MYSYGLEKSFPGIIWLVWISMVLILKNVNISYHLTPSAVGKASIIMMNLSGLLGYFGRNKDRTGAKPPGWTY